MAESPKIAAQFSHGLVNSAMGQIPCSTEHISCFSKVLLHFFLPNVHVVLFVFYGFLLVQIFLPWNPVIFIMSACLLFSIMLFCVMLMFVTNKLSNWLIEFWTRPIVIIIIIIIIQHLYSAMGSYCYTEALLAPVKTVWTGGFWVCVWKSEEYDRI